MAVPVLAHMAERGTILSAADFEAQPRVPGMAAGALGADAAAGRELVRTLPAGAVVRAGDVVAPRLVRRGEPVTVTLRSGGLSIATGGRALSAGGMGDLVRVVTASTNRTLDGVVEGSGRVRIAAH
ncbi:flagellar basal body P-ring formation chaperone FlgA [Sphingomonas sp.]|uniref:flagellar basal body P-ring formation chaperone FlgA n=1 Tax=Sphingomonas sp. TaxID=28214 RepID=UPI002ED8379E